MSTKKVFFGSLVATIVLLSFILYMQPRIIEVGEPEIIITEVLIPDPDYVRPEPPDTTVLVDSRVDDEPEEFVSEGVQNEILRKTDEQVTVVVNEIDYEVRGEDFATVNRIAFEVINHANNSIEVVGLLYIWDENDPFRDRALVRTRIPLNTYFGPLAPNESLVQNSGINIPVNDIQEQKTLKITIAESVIDSPKAFVSGEISFNISKP